MSDQNLLSVGEQVSEYEKLKNSPNKEAIINQEIGYSIQRSFSNKNKKDERGSTSPAVQMRKQNYRPKGGSIDPKGSWNFQNQAYTSNMAFNVAYNTFNSQKNSFMQIYTNKKQRQEIY